MEILAFIFVNGKFIVFSHPFGIGFALQYQRMNKDDKVFCSFFQKKDVGIADYRKCAFVPDLVGRYTYLICPFYFTPIWFRIFLDKRLLIWTIVLLLMPVINWLAMSLTDNFYPGYFFRLHNELASRATTGFTDGQNITRFSIRDYMAISSIQELLEMNLLMPLRRLGGSSGKDDYSKSLLFSSGHLGWPSGFLTEISYRIQHC